jgi:hypothetical protein
MDPNSELTRALEAVRRGAMAEAERICRSILSHYPQHFGALAILGDIQMQAGKWAEALNTFQAALKLRPDSTLLREFTAILTFRQAFGAPPEPRQSRAGSPRIQMTTLGANGRYGNQLLQYALVRLYAEKHDLIAQFPDWIGRDLFDFDDPLPDTTLLPRVDERDVEFFASLNGATAKVYSESDIFGYFCGNTGLWSGHREKFRKLFAPSKKIQPLLDQALGRLTASAKTIIALHLRRGDFGYGPFWIAPPSWYVPWLDLLWAKLEQPLLYVASDVETLPKELAKFSPWNANRLGIRIPGVEFLVDHHILRHADHLAIANSTFSFAAAMLNTRAQSFVRPDPDLRVLVPFDPWNADVLIHPTVKPRQLSQLEETCIRRLIQPEDTVVYIGQFCSPWTNFLRRIHGYQPIIEADPGASLDQLLFERRIARLNHLVLEDASLLAEVLAGAKDSLRTRRIDAIHFSVAENLAQQALVGLTAPGFRVSLIVADGRQESPTSAGPLTAGRYVARPVSRD